MCIFYLEISIDNVLADIDESCGFKDFETLGWTLFAYKELYSRMINKSEDFEDIIGEFQSELVENSRRNPLTNYMFMYMFNVIAEFLEYIYVMREEYQE